MKEVFFVNTQYQLEVSLDVVDLEMLEKCIYIAPAELKHSICKYCPEGFGFIFLERLNDRHGFFDARKLLKEIRRSVKSLKNENVRLWLANDDHVLGQFLLNYLDVKEVRLFEDGMGSYIKHKPFMLDAGLRGVLSKVKKIVYFAPYYRSLYRFGEGVAAKKCYAYNNPCFPAQDLHRLVVIDKKVRGELAGEVWYLPEGSVMIIGQPLVEMNLMSRKEYWSVLDKVISQFFYKKHVVYKPHPREIMSSGFSNDIKFFIDSENTAEDEIVLCGKEIIVCGFFSTVLLNSTAISNVSKVLAIRSSSIKVPSKIYDALLAAGCEIVDI